VFNKCCKFLKNSDIRFPMKSQNIGNRNPLTWPVALVREYPCPLGPC